MKLPKRPANKAEEITKTISKKLKKDDGAKEGVNLVGLAKKMSQRRETILKKDDENEDENEE